MAKSFRRVFFWSLVAFFFFSAPFAVLYALGYRYHADRGIFVYTGSITIKSNPTDNVSIRLNGKDVSADISTLNRSFTVGGLKPGKYRIDVSAPGFTSWSKEAIVSSGVSTEFWNVLLPRESYTETRFPIPAGSLQAFPSPKADRIAFLASQNDETTVDILDRDTGTLTQVFSSVDFDVNRDSSLIQSVSWSNRDEKLLLIHVLAKNSSIPTVFMVHSGTGEATDLRDVVEGGRIDDARWDPSKNAIVVLSGRILSEVMAAAPWENRHIADNIESFDFFDTNIAVLSFGTSILSFFPSSRPENRTQLTTMSPDGFSPTLSENSPRYSLVAYDRTRMAILNRSTGDCFLWNSGESSESFSQLSSEARGIQFSDDGKKTLYWTDWEIFSFFTRKWEVQPSRAEGDRIDVGRFSEPIRNVQWSKDYEHVLFSSANEVLMTELDGRGGRNLSTILRLPTVPEQVATINADNLLFSFYPTEDKKSFLLSEIAFPEPVGLFGIGG